MEILKKRLFYIFLLVHVFVWSLIPLLRNVISIDSLEAIAWGELISFGTNKHPPLSGWLASSFYNIFQSDFIIYLLGQLFILLGFIYIYKLAKCFLSEEKSFISVMLLEACFYYTWIPFVDNFNCNILMQGLWPVSVYYFYKSIKDNKILDWCLFGFVSGLCMLGKYQCVFLFFSMFIYLLFFKREQFKQKGMYIALLIGSLVIAPHVIWLFKTDFFSFSYMVDSTQRETHNLPLLAQKMKHIFYPFKFILGQLMAFGGSLFVYLMLALFSKNISLKNSEAKKENAAFILIVGLCPVVIQGIMGFITGNRIPSIWGSSMIGLFGVLLCYFFPINLKENSFKFFNAIVYLAMFVTIIVVTVFMRLQTQFVFSYPYQKIMPEINEQWELETNNAVLKYVGGYIDWVFYWRAYDKNHPQVILETFGHKNPWVNQEDIYKSGAIIFDENEDLVKHSAHDMIELLPSDYSINTHKYDFDVCNIYDKCYTETFYYAIIPPLPN